MMPPSPPPPPVGNNPQKPGDTKGKEGKPVEMDIMGDLRDQPVVIAMFLLGVMSYLWRERCVC